MIGGRFHFRAVLPCGEVREWTATNTPTHEGLRAMLDNLIDTDVPTWEIAFVNTAGFTGYAQTDTDASHPGWTESTHAAFAGSTLTIAGDDLSATDDLESNVLLLGPMDIRGCFVRVSGGGIIWATADFNEGAQSLPTGTDLTTIYTTSIS